MERSNKKSYLITESGHEIEDQVREAEQDIRLSDKRLNTKYREYRDKILQVKITVNENEEKFSNKAQMIEELFEMKLKKIVGRSEIGQMGNRNRWNPTEQTGSRILQPGSLDLMATFQKLQRLKAQICESQSEILDPQQKQKVEQKMVEIQKTTARDVQGELQNLDADFQKHYNTLEQIIQSISTKIT